MVSWDPAEHPRNPENGQFVGKLYSWAELSDLYGDLHDEFQFGDSGTVAVFSNGDTAILFSDGDDQYDILTDGIDAPTAEQLADTLDWAATAEDLDTEPSANGLVDWQRAGDTHLVGYDPAGDVRVGPINGTGDDTEDGTDLGWEEAEQLAEALRNAASRLDELDGSTEADSRPGWAQALSGRMGGEQ